MMLKAPPNGCHKVGCMWNRLGAWWAAVVVVMASGKTQIGVLDGSTSGVSIPGSFLFLNGCDAGVLGPL